MEFSPSIRKAAVFDRETEIKKTEAKFQSDNSNGYNILNKFAWNNDEEILPASPPKPQIRKSSVKKNEDLFSVRSKSPAFDIDAKSDEKNSKSSRKSSIENVLASYEEPKIISRDVSPIKTARDSPLDDFFSQDDDKKEPVVDRKVVESKQNVDSDDELFNSTIKASEVTTQMNKQSENVSILEKQFSNASLASSPAKSESPKKMVNFDDDDDNEKEMSKKGSHEDLFSSKGKNFSDDDLNVSAAEKRNKFTKSVSKSSNDTDNEFKSNKKIIDDDPFGDYGGAGDADADEDDDFEKMLMTKKREQMNAHDNGDDEFDDDDFGAAPKAVPRTKKNIFSNNSDDSDSF